MDRFAARSRADGRLRRPSSRQGEEMGRVGVRSLRAGLIACCALGVGFSAVGASAADADDHQRPAQAHRADGLWRHRGLRRVAGTRRQPLWVSSALVSHDPGDTTLQWIKTDDDGDGTEDTGHGSRGDRNQAGDAERISAFTRQPQLPEPHLKHGYELQLRHRHASDHRPECADPGTRLRLADERSQAHLRSSSSLQADAPVLRTMRSSMGGPGSNFGKTSAPGASQTYTYNGDDSDTSGDSDLPGHQLALSQPPHRCGHRA